MATSSSLLTLVALGTLDARADQQCGTPVSGVVNCSATSYPDGITYSGFDDLTINVGEPAGQLSAVSLVDNFIYQDGFANSGIGSQKIAIGKNVTITTDTFGVWQSEEALTYRAPASATAEIDNDGMITTTEVSRTGMKVMASAMAPSFIDETTVTSYASGTVRNSGAIVTQGNSSPAILVNANAMEYRYTSDVLTMSGLAEVDNSGILTTSGRLSQAISVTAATGVKQDWLPNSNGDFKSGSSDLASVGVTSSGGIQTSGDSAQAIYAMANASGFAETVTGKTTLTNSGIVETYGSGANAIELRSIATGLGAGNSYIASQAQFTNTGAITTHGDEAIGALVDAETASPMSLVIDAGATIKVSNAGSIVTSGDSAPGLMVLGGSYTLSGGKAHGDATITNTAAITTSGKYSGGLMITLIDGVGSADSTGSVLRGSNAGAIATEGDGSNAISVSTRSLTGGGAALSDLEFTNTGDLTVAGGAADAISAFSTANSVSGGSAQLDSGVWVTNSGAITLSGSSTQQGPYGILATAKATGDVASAVATANVSNSGAITLAGIKAVGIDVASTATDAVSADAGSGTPAVESYAQISNTSPISVSGDNVAGLWGHADAVLNDIAGKLASGAQATSGVTITNSNTVNAEGQRASAVLADAKAESFSANPAVLKTSITVTNSGMLQATGANSVAIKASVESVFGIDGSGLGQSTDSISVTNTGSIVASGDSATGVSAIVSTLAPPPSGGDIYYVAAQSVISSVAAPVGNSRSSSILMSNSGSIVTSGDGGNGVFAYGQSVRVENFAGGVISGGSSGFSAGVYASGTTVVVTNGGSIGAAGNRALNLTGSGTVSVENKAGGIITGFITANSPSFTFTNNGTWVARGGDSDFGGRSSIVVNKATVLVVGGQYLKGLSTFDNGGMLSLSAANTAPGPRARFEELIVSGDFIGGVGSVLEIGSDMTTRADHLEIDGTVSGTTTLVVDPMASPGLTTGNGVLVVDATLGTTSAGNFKLAGNTAAGTLVDGAYEYALNLVAGSSGHGAWYLSSRVYPGVDQFGQLSSSSLLISEVANGPLPGLVQQDWGAQGGRTTGQRIASNDPSFAPSTPTQLSRSAFWGGYDYAHLSVTPGGAAYGGYNMDVSTGHLGLNAAFDGNGRTLVLGLEYSPVDASIDLNQFGSTHIDTSGSAVSGSALWIEGPWRAGVKYSYDKLHAHFTDGYLGTDARVRLSSYGLQIGGAYMGHFDEDTYVEPWATLSYASVGKAGFMDGIGDQVQLDGTHSTLARLGARIGRLFDLDAVLLRPYAELAVDYRFGGESKVTVGNYTTSSTLDGASVRGGGGIDAKIGESLSVFGDIVYFGGGKQDGWQGSIGLRLTP